MQALLYSAYSKKGEWTYFEKTSIPNNDSSRVMRDARDASTGSRAGTDN